ncbi:MAG: hypothetical protein JWN49_641 [Parcubacteria group bacterium]|nr:hypothetical protein [Parcubacteria group bacterium]
MTDTNPPQQNTLYIQSALKAGLSAKASSVYVTLLEAGVPLSPKTIILRSGLHRQYVYDAIKELQERDLISSVGKDRAIKYGATSPDKLVQEIEKQRIDTLDSVQELMKLYDKSPAGLVEIIRGNRAVIESELKILEEARDGDFLDIIGGAGMEWVNLFEGRIEEWEALRKEKGVKLRYIGSGEDVRHNREDSVIENESRAIPGIGDIVNISIRPDSVSFNFYQPEVMTIRVKNAAAVESQRALFEVLWNAAK